MRYEPKSTYVPTTDEVETGFHEFASKLEAEFPGEYEQAPEFSDWREAMHGFRRWYAEEIRKAKEEAYEQGRIDERHDSNLYAKYQQGKISDERYQRESSRNPYRKEKND